MGKIDTSQWAQFIPWRSYGYPMDIHDGHMDTRLDIHRISTGYPKDRFVDIFLGTRSQKSNLSVFD